MNKKVYELRADKILSTLTEKGTKKTRRTKQEFQVSEGLITLTSTQKAMLVRSLEIYFPDLYIDVKYKRPYIIECESTLDDLLTVLDERMSKDEHFELYKNTTTEEYNFLTSIRLQHMVK